MTTCGHSEVRLLPTPSATEYGSNQSPSPGAAVRPSLDGLVKLLPTPRADPRDATPRSARDDWRPSLSEALGTLSLSPSSQAASPAKAHPPQASGRDSGTPRPFCGTRCGASLASFHRATWSSKTSATYLAWLRPQASLLDPSGEVFSQTWPRSGTTRSGTVYPLAPSAPRTSVTGCFALLLLPTPTKQDGSNVAGEAQQRRNTPPLNAMVRMLPTPHGMAKEGQAGRAGPTGNELGRALTTQLPSTGATTDPPSTDGQRSTEKPQLRLSPEFVEWLMGAPTCSACGRGWTDSDCPHSAMQFTPTSDGLSGST